jgi:hypothetical protein
MYKETTCHFSIIVANNCHGRRVGRETKGWETVKTGDQPSWTSHREELGQRIGGIGCAIVSLVVHAMIFLLYSTLTDLHKRHGVPGRNTATSLFFRRLPLVCILKETRVCLFICLS